MKLLTYFVLPFLLVVLYAVKSEASQSSATVSIEYISSANRPTPEFVPNGSHATTNDHGGSYVSFQVYHKVSSTNFVPLVCNFTPTLTNRSVVTRLGQQYYFDQYTLPLSQCQSGLGLFIDYDTTTIDYLSFN